MADLLTPRRRPSTTVVAIVVILVVAVAAGAYFVFWRDKAPDASAATSAAPKGKGKGGADPNRAIPVVTDIARKSDINLYLNGLGTVLPLKTVTVRSRVDGELVRVNFVEGQ
ncbi:MAG: hypothetical protein JO035_12155, partial [Betaproteobacteria bacterium]|nr:hypothetical protein [Betaproteobacteria bacterium]